MFVAEVVELLQRGLTFLVLISLVGEEGLKSNAAVGADL